MIEKEYLDRIEKLELQAKILSSEIDLLRKRLEKINFEENECERWRAKQNEDYWFIDCIGNIYDDYEAYKEEDNFKYAIGNYFQTQQDAQDYKENLITKQKLKDLALRLNKGVEIDWEIRNESKFYIAFCHEENLLTQDYNVTQKSLGQIYCLDEDFLDIAKKEIGEEALIKLIKSGV